MTFLSVPEAHRSGEPGNTINHKLTDHEIST